MKAEEILGCLSDKLDRWEERFGHIVGNLEKLDSRIDNIDITIAKQQVTLDEHVRRTNLLEKKVNDSDVSLTSVTMYISQLNILFKTAGFILGSSSILGAIIWITKKLIF